MKKTILVTDDNVDTVDLIETILKDEGYNVLKAYSGEECLRKLAKNKVDLVSLDIMMPGLSGWDVYARIQKKFPKLPVIFLSALDVSEKRRKELMKEGIIGYIVKPFRAEDLIETIEESV